MSFPSQSWNEFWSWVSSFSSFFPSVWQLQKCTISYMQVTQHPQQDHVPTLPSPESWDECWWSVSRTSRGLVCVCSACTNIWTTELFIDVKGGKVNSCHFQSCSLKCSLIELQQTSLQVWAEQACGGGGGSTGRSVGGVVMGLLLIVCWLHLRHWL